MSPESQSERQRVIAQKLKTMFSFLESEVESEVESKVKSEVKSEVEAKAEAKVEARVEAKVEAKVESKVEAKAESKAESESESRISEGGPALGVRPQKLSEKKNLRAEGLQIFCESATVEQVRRSNRNL